MRRNKKLISFQLLIVITATVIALSAVGVWITISGLRADAVRAAERDCDNNALFVADQIARSIHPIDTLLTELQQHVFDVDLRGTEDFRRHFESEQMFLVLEEHLARVSRASVIAIFAADGEQVTSTRAWPTLQMNHGDREFFWGAGLTEGDEIHVSGPIISRSTGVWTVYFTQRIDSRVGDLLGVVTVGVELGYFNQIYDTYSSLVGRSFIVSRLDGTTIANRPDMAGLLAQKMPANTGWYDAIRAGGGAYISAGIEDPRQWIFAARLVRGLPLAVTVGILEDSALTVWRHRAISIATVTMLVALCALALLWGLTHQFGRLAVSEASLAEREARLAEKSGELEAVNMRLDAALNNMSHGLCMFDREQRLQVCNERYLEMYRLSRDEVRPGILVRDVITKRIEAGTFAANPNRYEPYIVPPESGTRQSQLVADLTNGRTVSVFKVRLADGGWVAVHEDITERRRAEQQIAHMARYDALTDVANRTLFNERMDQALERLACSGSGFALFIFDIDLFKAVNDSLGHPLGDALLRQVARRVADLVGPTDTVGRLGGDEFGVIQITVDDAKAEAEAFAERLLRGMSAPYEIEGQRITIGISTGIALAPRDGTGPSQLLENADLALYRAKQDGRNCYRFFEPDMDAKAKMQRAFEFELREALIRQEFEIHYQPIVGIDGYRPCAAEALVRWRHPEHGLITPDKFIPVAEEIGLIIPLGEWILRTACATAATWPDDIRLAVNLSAVQFRSGTLVDIVRSALAESGLPATRLELEITESVLLQKDQAGLSLLHQLADLGVRIVLDDFGTGYSSLSYLQMFPFRKIKIDRSFVAELSSREECAAIVRSVVNLAKMLGITTTAEGVETWEQVAWLRTAGCSELQGYLFGRPALDPTAVLDPAIPRRSETTAA